MKIIMPYFVMDFLWRLSIFQSSRLGDSLFVVFFTLLVDSPRRVGRVRVFGDDIAADFMGFGHCDCFVDVLASLSVERLSHAPPPGTHAFILREPHPKESERRVVDYSIRPSARSKKLRDFGP